MILINKMVMHIRTGQHLRSHQFSIVPGSNSKNELTFFPGWTGQ
jgi:hypothetical protein